MPLRWDAGSDGCRFEALSCLRFPSSRPSIFSPAVTITTSCYYSFLSLNMIITILIMFIITSVTFTSTLISMLHTLPGLCRVLYDGPGSLI